MSETMPEVLISEEEIHAKVEELARRISADYRDVDDLIMVGILKGSFIFLADLARHLTIPRSVDFMALSTYGNATDTDGAVRMIMDLRRNIAGKHVLIVEDIVDTGYTLAYLVRTLAARQPASLKTCVLGAQAGAARGLRPDRLPRFRDPRRMGRRLRSRLGGEIPGAAVYRGGAPGGMRPPTFPASVLRFEF